MCKAFSKCKKVRWEYVPDSLLCILSLSFWMQNSDDAALNICSLHSLFSLSSLYLPKNAHEDRMLLVFLKTMPFRTPWPNSVFFAVMLISLTLRDNLSVCSAYFTTKSVMLCKTAIMFFSVCVCRVRCPPVRPGSKKVFMSLSTSSLFLWCFELMKIASEKTRREEKRQEIQEDASRVYVALCHLISEATQSYCLFLKLSARTREPSMVPFLWGPRLKRLPPKKQHWRPNCE